MARTRKIVMESVRATSLKGIPRLVNSKHRSLKALWILGLLVLLGICIYQVRIIINEYFSYSIITNVSEKPLQLVNGDSVKIPNILLCNLNPHNSNTSHTSGVPTVDEFIRAVEKLTSCTKDEPCTDHELSYLTTFKDVLLTPEGYFQYIKQEAAQKVGPQLETLIAACSLITFTGSSTYEHDCKGIVTFTPVAHAAFFQCVIVHFPEQSATQITVGITLTLYMDNFYDPFKRKEFFKNSRVTSQGSGAYIVLHEPGTFPIYLLDHEYAATGNFFQVRPFCSLERQHDNK